jgi:hypothetical protein
MSLPTIDEPVVPQPLVQVWRESCENKAQARHAYAQFVRRGARSRVNGLAAVGWLLAGMLLSMGSLYAADGAPLRWLGIGVTARLPEARQALAQAHGPGPLQASVPVPSAAVVTPAPSLPAVEPAPRSEPKVGPAVSGTAKTFAPEQWQRVARALRERDFASADTALRALTARTTGDEREAAQLAHAQLLLSNGHDAAALSLLHSLQQSAGSSSVRRKSGELLARRRESDTPERSAEVPGGANQP